MFLRFSWDMSWRRLEPRLTCPALTAANASRVPHMLWTRDSHPWGEAWCEGLLHGVAFFTRVTPTARGPSPCSAGGHLAGLPYGTELADQLGERLGHAVCHFGTTQHSIRHTGCTLTCNCSERSILCLQTTGSFHRGEPSRVPAFRRRTLGQEGGFGRPREGGGGRAFGVRDAPRRDLGRSALRGPTALRDRRTVRSSSRPGREDARTPRHPTLARRTLIPGRCCTDPCALSPVHLFAWISASRRRVWAWHARGEARRHVGGALGIRMVPGLQERSDVLLHMPQLPLHLQSCTICESVPRCCKAACHTTLSQLAVLHDTVAIAAHALEHLTSSAMRMMEHCGQVNDQAWAKPKT